MALFLDSAVMEEAQKASNLGFVYGSTTNPALLIKAGHVDFKVAMRDLCSLYPGPVFYQFTRHSVPEMRAEYEEYSKIAPNLGFKIPCTLVGLQMSAEISKKSVVAITSVFKASQAYLAAQSGAKYVIPYYNRTERYTGCGAELIAQLYEVLADTDTEILAAGIKSSAEVVACITAGAHNISVPWQVIQEMAECTLSQQAIAEFDQVLIK